MLYNCNFSVLVTVGIRNLSETGVMFDPGIRLAVFAIMWPSFDFNKDRGSIQRTVSKQIDSRIVHCTSIYYFSVAVVFSRSSTTKGGDYEVLKSLAFFQYVSLDGTSFLCCKMFVGWKES